MVGNDALGMQITEYLLDRMARRGWQFRRFAPLSEDVGGVPVELAVVARRSEMIADVAVLRGDGSAIAYRAVLWPGDDPVTPQFVTWVYRADAQHHVLRAVHMITSPAAPVLMPAPRDCGVRHALARERAKTDHHRDDEDEHRARRHVA